MDKNKFLKLDDNPFIRFKISKTLYLGILVCFCLFFVGILLSIILQDTLILNEPLFGILFIIFFVLIWIILIIYQLHKAGVKFSLLIGKVPENYNWLSLIFLSLMVRMFEKGTWRVLYYPVSFIYPDFFNLTIMINKTVLNAQASSFPNLYYFTVNIFYLIFEPLWYVLIYLVVLLYRLNTKYGYKKSILFLCIFILLVGWQNPFASLIYFSLLLIIYLKNCTLILPLIFSFLSNILLLIESLYRSHDANLSNATENFKSIDDFQSQFQLGIILVSLSAPYLLYWLYKNWFIKEENLPYFVNAKNLKN